MQQFTVVFPSLQGVAGAVSPRQAPVLAPYPKPSAGRPVSAREQREKQEQVHNMFIIAQKLPIEVVRFNTWGMTKETSAILSHIWAHASMYDNSLSVPRVKNNTRARAFHSYAPSLWNNLPLSVLSANSVATFKKYLKTHLFDLAFARYIPSLSMACWCYGIVSSILLLNTDLAVAPLSLASPAILALQTFDWLIDIWYWHFVKMFKFAKGFAHSTCISYTGAVFMHKCMCLNVNVTDRFCRRLV